MQNSDIVYFPANVNITPSETTHILILYTGGTFGCFHSCKNDPDSALDVGDWPTLRAHLPLLSEIEVNIDVVAFVQPLDSANMRPEHWAGIAQIISDNYDRYMGFVIIHGTDTMVYTASALSFMLTNLGKPVALTGSQIPIANHPRSDGVQNLMGAIYVAAYEYFNLPRIPEVVIVFGGLILRGNRTRKISANGFDAFQSQNIPPLGSLGDEISIHRELLLDPTGAFHADYALDSNVASLALYPGIQTNESFNAILEIATLRGIVLQCYGTGNAPTNAKFLEVIRNAIRDHGKHILAVTQSFHGTVKLGQYATGVDLLNNGVLSGSDITPEAALCKLMHLLGLFPEDTAEHRAEVAAKTQRSLAGEQSQSVYVVRYDPPIGGWRLSAVASEAEAVLLNEGRTSDFMLDIERVKRVVLHLGSVEVSGQFRDQNTFELEIALNSRRQSNRKASSALETKTSRECVEGKSVPVPAPAFISFRLDHIKECLESNNVPGIEIRTESGAGEMRWKSAFLYVFEDSH